MDRLYLYPSLWPVWSCSQDKNTPCLLALSLRVLHPNGIKVVEEGQYIHSKNAQTKQGGIGNSRAAAGFQQALNLTEENIVKPPWQFG